MNRNIVTKSDVERLRVGRREVAPRTTTEPPADDRPIKTDDWQARLAKSIPAEATAFYIALDSFIRTNAVSTLPGTVPAEAGTPPNEILAVSPHVSDEIRLLLLGALLTALVFNTVYLRRVVRVKRWTQIALSSLALATFIFGMGGYFATLQWYSPLVAGLAVIVVSAFMGISVPPGTYVEREADTKP